MIYDSEKIANAIVNYIISEYKEKIHLISVDNIICDTMHDIRNDIASDVFSSLNNRNDIELID